jgi:hypothetical protein
MRTRYRDGEFKLTLVAPSIPAYRSALLETIGIRCVEVPQIPETFESLRKVERQVVQHQKQEDKQAEISAWVPEGSKVAYNDLVGPVTRASLALSQRFLADTVDGVRRRYSEYETLPTKMQRAESGHFICGFPPLSIEDEPVFTGGGAWWACTFGTSEAMPKNDVPNLSVEAMPWGLFRAPPRSPPRSPRWAGSSLVAIARAPSFSPFSTGIKGDQVVNVHSGVGTGWWQLPWNQRSKICHLHRNCATLFLFPQANAHPMWKESPPW